MINSAFFAKAVLCQMRPGWFERKKPAYGYSLDAFVTALKQGKAPSPGLSDGSKPNLKK